MKKGDILFRALVLIICIGLPLFTFAQPDPPGDTPIDGGLVYYWQRGRVWNEEIQGEEEGGG